MTPTITIYRTIIEDEQGKAFVYFRETVQSATGPQDVYGHAVLPTFGDTPLAKDDWTNEDRRNALAAHLQIDPALIQTAAYVPPSVAPAAVPVV